MPEAGTTLSPSLARSANWSDRTRHAGRQVLAGERLGLKAMLPFAGPAVIASVAYMDPGNFATNIEAGSKYGYALLWVVLLANLTAMLFQALSAKVGIVTDRSLASLCRDHLPRPLVYWMWAVSEVAAMATDLAEFLGAAIGLSLLTGLPLIACLVATGVVTYLVLAIQRDGFRVMEVIICGFVLVIGLSYVIEILLAPPALSPFLTGLVTPTLPDSHAVTLAVGIIGATVMPHAIYLHSSLTQRRMPVNSREDMRRVLSFSNREVMVALSFAGLVNIAMVTMAAVVFHTGHSDVAEIETAYRTLAPLLGGAAAAVFMLSLIASGLSSSVVGTMAGQTIMQDFVHFRIPLWVRRLATMVPAFVVIWLGVQPTQALIISQVVLSLTLPVPMIALVYLSARSDIMGEFVSSRRLTAIAVLVSVIVLALNILLILQTAGVPIPGLDAG